MPPITIGAMGGSGTRVVARIVRSVGVFLGTNLNVSEDAMEFVEFYDRWINRFVRRHRMPLTSGEKAAMDAEFQDCIARHRVAMPAGQVDWGWKEPRSIYLLPYFHRHFPGVRFLHVVRDGRDMAFSPNQNQLRKHGDAVLESLGADGTLPAPVRTAELWNAINMAAADYGERVMKTRYLRIRFEEFCRNPEAGADRLCGFLGRRLSTPPVVADVSPPESIGRWRRCADSELMSMIEASATPALRRFGYLP